MNEEELKAFRNLNTFSTKYIVNKKASSENDIATMFIYIAKLEVELEHKDKEIERLHSIIKEVRELVENGTDFKCITFRKTDEDTWKLILASHIKEDFLEILDKENK